MEKVKVKICGIKSFLDIEYINAAKPDFIGYVFAKSKRQITINQARQFSKILKEDIIPVGVFVDEDINNIKYLCDNKIIKYIQLHGSEENTYIERLKKLVSVPIIKGIRYTDKFDFKNIDLADYYLIDGSNPGSGIGFNWDNIDCSQIDKPFFVAGGINYTNVIEAINKMNPFAIDISSGVEVNGQKDKEKIEEIIRKIKQKKLLRHGGKGEKNSQAWR